MFDKSQRCLNPEVFVVFYSLNLFSKSNIGLVSLNTGSQFLHGGQIKVYSILFYSIQFYWDVRL